MTNIAHNILIVDDNDTIRHLLAEILRAEGYTTSEASDGTEALELLEKTRVDAIISDIVMPNMDGYVFCYEVRRSRKHSTLPFIFLTATYTSSSDEQHALDLGADRILKKPISSKETLEVLREVFSNPLYQQPRAIASIKEVEVIKLHTDGLVIKLEEKNIELHEQAEELKKLTSTLEQTHEQLRHLLEHSPAVIYTLKIDGERVTPSVVSENIVHLLGFTAAESTRFDWPSHIHPEDRERASASVSQTIKRGIATCEYRLRHKDLHYLWVEDNRRLVRDAEGKPAEIVGAWTDITARKDAEKELQESTEQFRLIADNVADLIAVLDVNGKRLYSSPSYKNSLADPKNLLGSDSFADIHPDDRERMRKVYSETVRTGIGQRTEFRFLTKDGSVRNIESQSSTIRDEQGNVTKVIAVSRDVTEKKKLEAQSIRSQRMESLGVLAGGIAHDLNNVLAPIVMGVAMLLKKFKDEGSQKILRTLETSAQRGTIMVKQVLAFARGVSGERIILQTGYQIREIEKIVEQTFPKSIQFGTDVPRDLWCVCADATQLHRLLLNLCVNARDAMPDGGALTIAAANIMLDKNFARMNVKAKAGPYVLLTVTDSGTGIPPELLDKVFDPFFTTKKIGKGTGLGLSNVQSIVQAHGGFIKVYSEVGRGTKFHAYFPAELTAEEKKSEARQVEPQSGHGEFILVVDDEASVRDICQATLESYGYNVLTAVDGTEAVVLYTQRMNDIRLVITDMVMPFMDGRATIQALCKINPDVMIIATSGMQVLEKTQADRDLSIGAFLTKPFTIAKLLTTVADALASEERD